MRLLSAPPQPWEATPNATESLGFSGAEGYILGMERRTDMPSRPVIFHRAGMFYPVMIYADETPEQIGDHAAINPGTLKITDAVTGDVLWRLQ